MIFFKDWSPIHRCTDFLKNYYKINRVAKNSQEFLKYKDSFLGNPYYSGLEILEIIFELQFWLSKLDGCFSLPAKSIYRCVKDIMNFASGYVKFRYMCPIRMTWHRMDIYSPLLDFFWFLSNWSQITQACQFDWDPKGVPLLTFHYLNFLHRSNASLERWTG